MKTLWILLTLLATPLWAGEAFSTRFPGVWHGIGIQIDAQEWPMELRLSPGAAEVEYPSLQCGGNWRFLKETPDQIVAVEKVTYGLDECLDGGLVRLESYQDSLLVYRWYDNAGKAVAGAVLIEGPMRPGTEKALLRLTIEALGKGFVKGEDTTDVDIGDIRI